MRLKLWIALLSSVVLLFGCVSPSGDFCDVARPIYIGSGAVVDWLAENDEPMLRAIVSHNEKTASCR